jgi:hypothetical protein
MRTDFPSLLQYTKYTILSSAAICLLTLFSCEERDPGELGRDLLPDSDDFSVSFDSVELIQAITTQGDSIITSGKTTQLLGCYEDPVFGKSTASFITQVEAPGKALVFGSNPVIDSVILFIYVSDFYGDEDANHQIIAYEYNDLIEYDTSYYSNFNPEGKYKPVAVGSGTAITSDTLLKIYISDEELKNRFLTAEDTVFKSNTLFQEMFRGFYLTTEDITTGGSIMYTSMNSTHTNLTFYFKNDEDTSRLNLLLGRNYGQSINIFNHDYQGAMLADYFIDQGNSDSLIFLQGMGGVQAIVRFPQLTAWLDSIKNSGPIAVNNAELIFTPEIIPALNLNTDQYPTDLNLFWIDDDKHYHYLYDDLLNSDLFGGQYNEDDNNYKFYIKIHLQSYFTGKIGNTDLVLSAGDNANSANRVILKGGNHSSGSRLKLKMTYTKL